MEAVLSFEGVGVVLKDIFGAFGILVAFVWGVVGVLWVLVSLQGVLVAFGKWSGSVLLVLGAL